MWEEPRAGRLAAWGNALFAGLVSPDEAADRAVGGDVAHRVAGLPGEVGVVGLTLAFGRLRSLGVVGLRVALPVAGHPLGLCGPPEFNAAALAAGEAVLASGHAVGLVPEMAERGPAGEVRAQVLWRCRPVRESPPADVPSLGESERELAEVLRDTTEALTRRDMAGAGPAAQARLAAYRARTERGRQLLAPGYPPRAVRVLELAQRVGALVAIARDTAPGASVSAGEVAERDRLLRSVERAARRARVAAYNAYVEKLERRRG